MKPSYNLLLHNNIEKQLSRIPKKDRERIVNKMRSLRDDPRPSGTLKLDKHLYRIRQGEYRIIYAVFDDKVVVFVCKVSRRSKATYNNIQPLLDRALEILGKEE